MGLLLSCNPPGSVPAGSWCNVNMITSVTLTFCQEFHSLLYRLVQGDAVEINVSPLSSNRHASLLAATNALSQAVHLHSRVLEDVLRQLHARQQHSVVRAPSAAAVGMQQATSSAIDAPNTKRSSVTRQQDLARASDVCGAEQSGVLYADGMYMGDDLSQCWVALCQSQAQVDLAVSQLAAHQ